MHIHGVNISLEQFKFVTDHSSPAIFSLNFDLEIKRCEASLYQANHH
jgi:hypothetical protein